MRLLPAGASLPDRAGCGAGAPPAEGALQARPLENAGAVVSSPTRGAPHPPRPCGRTPAARRPRRPAGGGTNRDRPRGPAGLPPRTGNANHRAAYGKRALRGVGGGAAGPPSPARRGHRTARAPPRAARTRTGSTSVRPGAAETSADAVTFLFALRVVLVSPFARPGSVPAVPVHRGQLALAKGSRSPGTDRPKPRAAGPGGLLRWSPKRIRPVGLRVTGRRASPATSASAPGTSVCPGSALRAAETGPRAAHTGTVAVGGDCGDSSGNNTRSDYGPGVRSLRDWPGEARPPDGRALQQLLPRAAGASRSATGSPYPSRSGARAGGAATSSAAGHRSGRRRQEALRKALAAVRGRGRGHRPVPRTAGSLEPPAWPRAAARGQQRASRLRPGRDAAAWPRPDQPPLHPPGPAAETAEQAGGRRLLLPVLACYVCGESPESHDAGLNCSPEGR